MWRRKPFTPFTLALLLLVPQVLAAAVVPDSGTFVISLPSSAGYCGCYHNFSATVVSLGEQGFAVGWEQEWQDFYTSTDCYNASPAAGVRSVRAGNRLSSVEPLEPTTSVDAEDGRAWDLSFANLGGGRFVSVANVSEYWDEFPGGVARIWYRRFAAGQPAPDSDSVPMGGFGLSHWEVEPRAASGGNGLFVLAWSREVSQNWTWQKIAQVFGADGEPVSPEIAVTEPMKRLKCCGDPLVGPEVGMAADGTFVVLWTDLRAALHPLVGRRFDHMGNPLGEPFWIANQGVSSGRPAMAMAPSGQFVVAWPSRFNSADAILVSRFAADGKRMSPVAQLAGDGDPAIALDRSGRVAVSWMDTRGIALAAFSASLKRLGPVVYDPTSLPGDPYVEGWWPTHTSVAFGEDGRILTVWVGHWGKWVRNAVLGRFWRAR